MRHLRDRPTTEPEASSLLPSDTSYKPQISSRWTKLQPPMFKSPKKRRSSIEEKKSHAEPAIRRKKKHTSPKRPISPFQGYVGSAPASVRTSPACIVNTCNFASEQKKQNQSTVWFSGAWRERERGAQTHAPLSPIPILAGDTLDRYLVGGPKYLAGREREQGGSGLAEKSLRQIERAEEREAMCWHPSVLLLPACPVFEGCKGRGEGPVQRFSTIDHW
ncbi:hypothetical protein M440DRAFT_1404937 [Trichoderma longibrachiatum ATCC 18648]|uniref:Uncharacterized protein n=1 Tax=Trichoderma longibrachiatum ATCC 18648 TaxID=983965 RepID=A0A2T4BV59_TRILO|nr:hypothetical protein M440DRAFT_1404937 [Trichoderma longibrachiatum ATCC 18648]